jgi:hypothetical protein
MPVEEAGADYEDIQYARSWASEPGTVATIGAIQTATTAAPVTDTEAVATPLEPATVTAAAPARPRRSVGRSHPWKTF